MYFESIKEYTEYLFDRKDSSEAINRAYDLLARSDDNIERVKADESLSPQEYIEVIALRRKEGYSQSTGSGNASAEHQTDLMYTNTPWKFVEEFLQNADDCKYLEKPEIEIIVNEKNGTVEFVYNEEGFTREDIWALTSFEQSTKSDKSDSLLDIDEEGVFYKEKTGRKGIGFKSVFSLKASNIRIHIRSNGYSFILDKAIGGVMPIWEDGHTDDGKTHVIVELINPKEPFIEIYPKFKEIFCIEETSHLFAKNPVLFMHRLQDITVKRIASDGTMEFFSIVLDYDPLSCIYEDSFVPSNTILAGIKQKEQFFRKQISYLNIHLKAPDKNILIPCVRETQMVDLDAKYRNISIIAPIMRGDNDNNWKDGSLFRTFPMMDNTFGIPLSIDAPFELNTARKGIEYGDSKGERQFNNKIINLIFNEGGLLSDFLLHIREIHDIRMDFYLKKDSVTLFENDANKDDDRRRLIPILDITKIMKSIPVFRLYENSGFSSYNRIFTVDSDLYSWLDAVKFLAKYDDRTDYQLASEIYSKDRIVRTRSVVDKYFARDINEYLDCIEAAYGIDSREYLDFIEQKLYPFLQRNETKLVDLKAYESLKVFITCIKSCDKIISKRETCKEGLWFTFTGDNHLSSWKYRIVESSPVDLKPLMNVLKTQATLKGLDEEFSGDISETANCRCNDWSDAKEFINSVYYYGYSLEKLRLKLLRNYAVSKEMDTRKSNYLRDAEILEIIPDDDIEELSVIFGNNDETVKFLYDAGLKNWLKIGELHKDLNRTYILYDESLRMIQSNKVELVKIYLDKLITVCKEKKYRILLSYDSFEVCDINIKLILLRNKQFVFEENYDAICDSILAKESYWKENSNECAELIVRARQRSNNSIPANNATVTFTLKYVVDNDLESLTQTVLKELQFDQFRIINDGFFEDIPVEEIQNTVAVLAPEKLNDVLEKKNVCFYKGDLSVLPPKNRYLIDGGGEAVYLHVDESGNYNDSLARYLNTSFDPITVKYFAELDAKNQFVYETYIKPVQEKYGYSFKEVFHRVAMDFPSRTDEEYVQILSWFRKQSYLEELGNASKNNENEIEDDYKDAPWKFVYEFIQNVDDCTYLNDNPPALGIVIDEQKGTVTFRYNEVGFTRDDVDALTKFANSNKEDVLDTAVPEDGLFNLEKTGRKGRGFKSVFSLSGKDISVFIESNGFSFKFFKRLGQIIPFWVTPEKKIDYGSRITVEGFRKENIGTIYQKLKNIFGISDINHFFSDCPLLYLRKLKKILVTNGSNYFTITISELRNKAIYSEKEFIIGKSKLYSGIRHENHYCEHEILPLNIKIEENGITRADVDAFRYSRMFSVGYKTRTVSLTAPIISLNGNVMFNQGGLYNTLPIEKNRYHLPIAINGPFVTDGGRSKVEDVGNALHLEIINVLTGYLLPEFYRYIREINNISIEKYIATKDDSIFSGYNALQEIDLKDLTISYPVFKLEGGDAYIPMKNARLLPDDCYSWINPVDLAESFRTGAKTVLVDHKYIGCKITIPRINLLDKNFVENLNRYIETISQSSWEDICALMHEHLLPFITSNFDEIRKIYRVEDNTKELKKLRIFVFKMSDGEYVIESADEPTIWLKGCPEQYQSYGNYRVLNNPPVDYTEEQLKWMRELHEIVDFDNAFTRNELAAKNVDTWEGAKTLIETVLYYGVSENITIPFLKRCIIDEKYDTDENIFRDAYKETQSSKIAEHYINEEDIVEIWNDVGEVWSGEKEGIANLIIQFGARRGNDFFKSSKKTVNCNDETLAVFEEYCTNRDRADQVLFLVKNAWNRKVAAKNSFDRLIVEYESIKDCSPAFLTSLFNSDLMEKGDMVQLAKEYCNTDGVFLKNADYTETFLNAAKLLEKKNVIKIRELSISLSEILERKLGRCIQDVMSKLESKIEFFITTDTELQHYPNEQINKALQWLNDSESGDKLSKDYLYYMTEIKEAFPPRTPESSMYLIDSEKVILNASTAREKDGLYTFVRRHYGGDDKDFGALLSIIREQEILRNWEGSKKQYINELKTFRKKTDGLKKVLYPGITDNINKSNSSSQEYIIPELLQNINDCRYSGNPEDRQLHIAIDIGHGIMKLAYDEDGFDFKNVYSITALGQSSKHDSSEGEKGLGFKKVFTLFDHVEIYSNGFFFKLTREHDTVPEWINEQEKIDKNKVENGTVMVFVTKKLNDLNRLANQWETLFKDPFTEGSASPLFLENIAGYKLVINGKRSFTVTRKEIIKGYHFIRKPLLKTYMDLLLQEESKETSDHIMATVRDSLRDRLKCKAMTENEFEDYVNKITVSLCFPKKMEKKIEGVFYSTLPTKTLTNSAIYINLPLELTTGRDAVLKESTYNNCIMRMVFHRENHKKSVYGMILEEAAVEMPDKEIFEYICADITNWIDNLSNNNASIKESLKKELLNLKLFHSYPGDKLVPLNDGYSVDHVLYQYLVSGSDIREDIEKWIRSHYVPANKMHMINISRNVVKVTEALEKYVTDIGGQSNSFPLSKTYITMVYDYFKDEYILRRDWN